MLRSKTCIWTFLHRCAAFRTAKINTNNRRICWWRAYIVVEVHMKQNFHPELNSPITTAARPRRARLAALIFVSTLAAAVAYPGAGCARRPQNRGAPSAQSAAESGGFHALSRSEAASHAAALANAECDRLYGVQPFREADNVATRSPNGYRWGGLQVG